MKKIHSHVRPFFLVFLLLSAFVGRGHGWAMGEQEILNLQEDQRKKPIGERIAFWAENFIGIPYDEDPQGIYVSRVAVVADEEVDCMYLTFRAVELALSNSPQEAVQIALDKRFHSRGILQDGKVVNYDDRFQYGEDMIVSGKWGKEITSAIGRNIQIQGSRGRNFWDILPPTELLAGAKNLRSGDILFFITPPEKRKLDEAVGHIGIIKVEQKLRSKEFFLIHASGTKNKGGAVKKVLLKEYILRMPFVGVKITRFE